MLIYGFGSDGMVSASKDIIKITGKGSNAYVQGYYEYDSKKQGELQLLIYDLVVVRLNLLIMLIKLILWL